MSQRGFLTPANDHEGLILAPLWLYGGVDWEAIPRGVLAELLHTWNYEALPGDKTIEETIEVYQEALARTFRQWTIPQPYYARTALLKPQSLIAYWPLWEGSGATLAKDRGPNAHDGTPAGYTWGSTGIGDGMTAVSLNGTTSNINVFSAGLSAIFDPHEGAFSVWVKPNNWNAASVGAIAYFYASANYRIYILLSFGTLYFNLVSNGVFATKQINVTTLSGWHLLSMAWSLAGNTFSAYLDGAIIGSPIAHPGSWSSAPALSLAVLGAISLAPAAPLAGSLAHTTLWGGSALDAEEIAYLATV